jgi:hypothetical protein
MTNLVIKHHKPGRRNFYTAIVVILLLVAGYLLFKAGVRSTGYDLMVMDKERSFWLQKEYSLVEELRKLKEQNAILQRGQQVEHEANNALEKSIVALQEELIELKSELKFYRGIVAPSQNVKGLNIQRLTLFDNPEEHSFDFKLVLTQVIKKGRRYVNGSVKLFVIGTSGGEEKQLSTADIGIDEDSKKMLFRFKYFQIINGVISLPDGFVASKVRVVLKESGKRKKQVTKEFEWVVEEQ